MITALVCILGPGCVALAVLGAADSDHVARFWARVRLSLAVLRMGVGR